MCSRKTAVASKMMFCLRCNEIEAVVAQMFLDETSTNQNSPHWIRTINNIFLGYLCIDYKLGSGAIFFYEPFRVRLRFWSTSRKLRRKCTTKLMKDLANPFFLVKQLCNIHCQSIIFPKILSISKIRYDYEQWCFCHFTNYKFLFLVVQANIIFQFQLNFIRIITQSSNEAWYTWVFVKASTYLLSKINKCAPSEPMKTHATLISVTF